jgi:hypothetical protein
VGGSERTGIVYGLQGWFSRQKQELGERQRRVFEGMEVWELDIEGKAEGKIRLVMDQEQDIAGDLV